MPTFLQQALQAFAPFAPYAVFAFCLLVGKAMKGSTKIPDWLIPPVLAGTGALMGAAMAVTEGVTWERALLTACAGLFAVGGHQLGRSIARQDNGPPPPKVDAIPVTVDAVPEGEACASCNGTGKIAPKILLEISPSTEKKSS